LKNKKLLTVALTLVFCFSVVLATGASPPTAKDLVLAKVKNFELGYDKGFYDKSESTSNFNITKFNGTVKDKLGDYAGTELNFLTQFNSDSNSIRINYDADIQGYQNTGDIYLKDDKVIFTKELLNLLQHFGADIEQEAPGLMQKAPQYLYVSDQQLNDIWEQMLSYQNQQLPEEYQEMLLFLVEAVPDKYFSISSGKVTLKLDQAGFEDVVFNLLTKIQNEKERFADIVVTANKYNYDAMGISPEEMRGQIILGVESIPTLTKEDIHMIGDFVDVNLIYEAAILPGGLKTFDSSIKFNAPGFANGMLNIKTESKGQNGNINGNYDITGNLVAVDGPAVGVQLTSNYKYTGPYAKANTLIDVKAEDTATGELYCDISANGETTSAVKKDLVIAVPELTAGNSLDVSTIMPADHELVLQPEPGLNLIVNDEYVETDIQPAIKDGRTMVPVKFVSEALDCDVKWLKPNEVRITNTDGKVISMYIDQSTYIVNGVKKQLDAKPYIENDMRTMVPVRFIAEELGATVELVGNHVVITK
jgi:hypothetical protein